MEPHTKGVSFRGLMGALTRLHGADALDRALAFVPDELANAVRFGKFVSSGWYPLAQYRALHAAAQRATGLGPELARALSREATLQDFRGIYRVLTAVLSPEFLIRRSPSLWRRYYEQGELAIPEAVHGRARAVFTNCTGFDRNLWEDAIGGCIGVLEACGARAVGVELVSGGGDGEVAMTMVATWR
jgi:hypothetical protein